MVRSLDEWEVQFRKWAKPPGDTEEQRMQNALKVVRNAIAASEDLQARNIRVIAQGSYRNNTNIPRESDVDVAVVCYDAFFPDYPAGTDKSTFGNVSANYAYSTFKNAVGKALVNYLGRSAVQPGNKAFGVKETSYHVEADVAPFFEHRRYQRNGSYSRGIELRPDNGTPDKVINWPEQHYENGVAKNNSTGRRYKALVRILKSLRDEMEADGISAAQSIPRGFLLECLGWNVPNGLFGHEFYFEDVRLALVHLYGATETEAGCSEWGEVSELKYLFRASQKWTRQQVNSFILAAWTRMGFQ
jgi:hypothetical protein